MDKSVLQFLRISNCKSIDSFKLVKKFAHFEFLVYFCATKTEAVWRLVAR